MRPRPAIATLSIVVLLLLAGPTQAQRAPVPDPAALAAATDLQRTGATAEVVAREVMGTHRQSGPQMIQILSAVRYATADIGRAVSAQTRASTATAASWLAEAAVRGTEAYAMLYEMDRSSAATVRTMVEAGYPAPEAVAGRQGIHPANLATHAADLRQTRASPSEVAASLGNVLQASARNTARAMLEAGYSTLEVTLALRDGYSLTPLQIGTLLVSENVPAVQILVAFLDPAYGLGETEAVTAFRGFGGEANQAATVLAGRGRGLVNTAEILTQAGYEAVAVGAALDGAYDVSVTAVVNALMAAGHTLTGAALWLRSEGVAGAEALVILRGTGATAQENARALIASSIIGLGQPAPFPVWARQAGYDCAQVALALRHEFGSTIVAAAGYLVPAPCTADETAVALDGAYDSSTADLVGALTQASLAPYNTVKGVVAAGHTVNATLNALLESPPGLTVESVFPDALVVPGSPLPIPYPDLVTWLKQKNQTEAQVATKSREAGMAATEVGATLKDVYGATSVTIVNAFHQAGYSAVQAVIAMRDGLGLTLEEMYGILSQLLYSMSEMTSAIVANIR